MSDSPLAGQDFAFALPLRWPEDSKDRREYEHQLVGYAQLMTPLLLASEGEQLEVVLPGMRPLVVVLARLWAPGETPHDVIALIDAVRSRESELE